MRRYLDEQDGEERVDLEDAIPMGLVLFGWFLVIGATVAGALLLWAVLPEGATAPLWTISR